MKKPQVYVLHGWSLATDVKLNWQPFIKSLEEHSFAVSFLCLPGFNGHLINEPWSLDMYVDWVEQQLPTEERVIVIGHSFGGQIAIRLASKYPEKIKYLVIIGAAGIRPQDFLSKAKRKTWKTVAKLGQVLTRSERARFLLYGIIGERDYLESSPIMRATMALVLEQDTQDDAARIQAPSLIIWGSDDRTTPLWIGKRYHLLIKNSMIDIIADARHSPHFSHPDEVVLRINKFASKNKK